MSSIASVMGLDPSLTATGVCVGWSEPTRIVTRVRTKSTTPMVTRMRDISRQVTALARDNDTGIVIVETPIMYAAHPGPLLDLAGLGWVLRTQLDAHGVTIVEVAGSQLKKWATGSGGSKKVHMVTSARERLGYQGHDDNEADALWLWDLGIAAYGDPAIVYPHHQLEVLAALTWPTVHGHTPTWVPPPKTPRKRKPEPDEEKLWP